MFKYLICLVTDHIWVGSRYHYCLRCGKLEFSRGTLEACEPIPTVDSEAAISG